MRSRIAQLAIRLRRSYWFVPGLMCAAAVLLSWATLALDRSVSFGRVLLYSGGPDGARDVLGTIAGSMITVAGVVFSITIVALTLASTQFGPRMLENFVRDRGNQATLGTFLGTFLYALLVLRSIRTGGGEVPELSVTVALLLAIAGLSVLIYFVHHIATSIQAPYLVARLGREFDHGVARLFPEDDVSLVGEGGDDEHVGLPEAAHSTVPAASSGYVQVVDLDGLFGLAVEHDRVVRLDTRPGRFVVRGCVVATVWPPVDEQTLDLMSHTITTGANRTSLQDAEFPARQLSEVAVRALSPSINDPFTAATCVQQLSVGLCRLAARSLPARVVPDPGDGRPRVVLGDPLDFAGLVASSYEQVRQSASYHAMVHHALLEALTRIVGCTRETSRLEPLEHQAREVAEAAAREVPADADRRGIQERYDAFLAAVASRRGHAV